MFELGKVFRINRSGVTVLCYHNIADDGNPYSVSPETLRAQLSRISVYARLVDFDKIEHFSSLNFPCVAISFDDGYADLLINAVPVMAEFNVKPAVFVLADAKNVNRGQLDSQTKLLNRAQLKTLAENGWVIGSHGLTHDYYGHLNSGQLMCEVVESKRMIEKQIGKRVSYFAYPKGYVTDEIKYIVKKAGYDAAFAVAPGMYGDGDDLFDIPRTIVDKQTSLSEFPALVSKTSLEFRKFSEKLGIGRLRWA